MREADISPDTPLSLTPLMGVSSQNLGRAMHGPLFLYRFQITFDAIAVDCRNPRPYPVAPSILQAQLHQHAVDPATEFEADPLEYADIAKAQGPVQPDRSEIAGIPDHRHHFP